MNATTAPLRLCFPSGCLLSGVKVRKVSAVCHCGFVTTPRVSIERADEALETEHGWTGAPFGCVMCWSHRDARRPWDALKPVVIEDLELWVCKDFAACLATWEDSSPAGVWLKCGCRPVYVKVFGHYHSPLPLHTTAAPGMS